MPEKEDSVAQRATALHQTLTKLLANPANGVSQLQPELRSLAEVLRRVARWVTKSGAGHDLRNLAEVAMIHLEPALKLVQQIPQNGPELTSKANEVRPQLNGALAQLISFGLTVVEKEEDQLAGIQQKADALLAAQKTEYDKVIADARAAITTANQAAATATESAKKVGVTVHMTAFALARDSSRRWSYAWATLAAVVACGLLGKVAYDIHNGSGPPNPQGSWYVAGNLSHYLARALLVSLVSYVLVFCTKNFRAAKHNETVNGHRASALATFDTLRSAGTSSVDDAITLHVAEAVFVAQPSGYDESGTPETHLAELLSMLRENRR